MVHQLGRPVVKRTDLRGNDRRRSIGGLAVAQTMLQRTEE